MQSQADPCLYTFNNGNDFMMLAVHVDDHLIASNNRSTLGAFKKRLNQRLSARIKDP